MEHLRPDEFIQRIRRGWEPKMKLVGYDGLVFDCICGQRHSFNRVDTPPQLELAGMRLVLKCPTSMGLTCVKVRGLFRRRFEAAFGTVLPDSEDPAGIGESLPDIAGRGIPKHSRFVPILDTEIRNAFTRLPHRVATAPFSGPDGNQFWVTVVFGLAQAEPGAPFQVMPKLSFTRLDRSSSELAHRAAVDMISNRDPETWQEHLPALGPDTGFDDSVRQMLASLGARLTG